MNPEEKHGNEGLPEIGNYKAKFFCTGSFFFAGTHGRTAMKVVKVTVPHTEMMCLISIWPTMLSAVGGDFDDDTVFVDIFRLDQRKMNVKYVKAGVWDHHFDEKGDYVNQGISSYIGPFNHSLDLRIVITGDDLAGTSYSVVEQ